MRVTVEIECPFWVKRAWKVALPALIIATAGVAFGVPKTFTAGETLTAADLNANFSKLPTTTEWAPYNPVVQNTNGTPLSSSAAGAGSTGYWRRVGDTAEVRIETKVNCTSGYPQWSLPPGLLIDTNKEPFSPQVGTGLAITAANVTVVVVAPQGAGNVVLQGAVPGSAVGTMDCNGLGANGEARMTFAVPIQGWTLNN